MNLETWSRWFLLGAITATAGMAAAQSYPTKPIRLIVPYPPGGATDIIAREMSQQLTKANGWTIVVDNRPGAGGTVGVDSAAKATADGYTLLIGQTSNLAIGPTLYKKLPYDPAKDLAPIGSVGTSPMVIVTAATSPYASFSDVLAAARRKPETVSFASSGNGSIGHLIGQQMQGAADIRLLHIPYKGGNQAVTDLMGGSVDLYFAGMVSVMPQIRNGKLRALAVTSATRAAELPDVPTVGEAGLKGFEAVAWHGLLAPAGTPVEVIRTLNVAMNKALQSAELRERLRAEGASATGGSPQQFADLIRTDIVRWGKIVKESGATAE